MMGMSGSRARVRIVRLCCWYRRIRLGRSGRWKFLWATDVDGNLVITRYSDTVKHTVLTGGEPVTGAGVVTINERCVVTRIDNLTGHFTPTQECSACFLQNGVDAFMMAGVPVPIRAIVDLGGK